MLEEPMPTSTPVDAEPRTAAGAWPLAIAGALLVLYPALRPWSDTTAAGAPVAFASPAWIPAHLSAVAGFVLVGYALVGLQTTLARTGGARLARLATSLWAAGTALVLPYYGAEAFALNALGERIVHTGDTGWLAVAEATRMGPWQVTTFTAGLLLLAAAGVLVAVAAARSGTLPRWAGLPFALAFALYLPQFFGPPALRIAHGALVGIGCLVLAAALVSGSHGR
jgi:hypothetical protein